MPETKKVKEKVYTSFDQLTKEEIIESLVEKFGSNHLYLQDYPVTRFPNWRKIVQILMATKKKREEEAKKKRIVLVASIKTKLSSEEFELIKDAL